MTSKQVVPFEQNFLDVNSQWQVILG